MKNKTEYITKHRLKLTSYSSIKVTLFQIKLELNGALFLIPETSITCFLVLSKNKKK